MTAKASAAIRVGPRWTTRIIPIILAATVGLTTYVVVKRVCLDFFVATQQTGAAIAILVLYFVFFVLTATAYVRTYVLATFNPDVIPLGSGAQADRCEKPNSRSPPSTGDVEAQRYVPGPDGNPDKPGLEEFHSKDVFVCEADGRPRWCSRCSNWKPDRVYHNSEINRCVRKLDHYCPWAGGVVSQSSYKFFVQFCFYAALYWAVVVSATGIRLRVLLNTDQNVDGFVVATLSVASFFGLFSFTMTMAALRCTILNVTNVESLKQRSSVIKLAMRVPTGIPTSTSYSLVTYPLPRPDGLSSRGAGGGPSTAADQLSTRTFAVVSAARDDNPWDLGYYRNFTSVMGTNPTDWFLPIRMSPCTTYVSSESFYEMGPLYRRLRKNLNLPLPTLIENGMPSAEDRTAGTT